MKYFDFPSCSRAFYDIPPDQHQRKAGFGYGTKYDFTKLSVKTPAPNSYSLPSDFKNKGDKLAKAISFGESRDVFNFNLLLKYLFPS